MDRVAAKRMSRAVLSGLIRRLLSDVGVPGDKLGARQLARVVGAVRDREGGERTFSFAGGVTLSVARDRVTVGRYG